MKYIWIVFQEEKAPGKYIAGFFRVSANDNLVIAVKGYRVANFCTSYKRAKEIAAEWANALEERGEHFAYIY